MLALGLYLLGTLIAISWVVLDDNAVAAFEIFNRCLHSTARHMGIYWKWLVQTFLRAALLLSCVISGVVAATWIWQRNPWDLPWLGKTFVFAAMLVCSIAISAMPHLTAYFRLRHFLHFKAAELTNLALNLSSSEGVRQHLEPADNRAFRGVEGWTAWHPRQERWHEEACWTGLVPLAYLHQDQQTSLIVPVDFEYFLAWNLPQGSVLPGKLMPIYPRCYVKAVRDLPGYEGWSVVRADMEIEEAIGQRE